MIFKEIKEIKMFLFYLTCFKLDYNLLRKCFELFFVSKYRHEPRFFHPTKTENRTEDEISGTAQPCTIYYVHCMFGCLISMHGYTIHSNTRTFGILIEYYFHKPIHFTRLSTIIIILILPHCSFSHCVLLYMYICVLSQFGIKDR